MASEWWGSVRRGDHDERRHSHPSTPVNEDKATRYNRLKRRVGIISVGWAVVFLLALVVSGGSIALRDGAVTTASALFPAGWTRPSTVVIYVALVTLLN